MQFGSTLAQVGSEPNNHAQRFQPIKTSHGYSLWSCLIGRDVAISQARLLQKNSKVSVGFVCPSDATWQRGSGSTWVQLTAWWCHVITWTGGDFIMGWVSLASFFYCMNIAVTFWIKHVQFHFHDVKLCHRNQGCILKIKCSIIVPLIGMMYSSVV